MAQACTLLHRRQRQAPAAIKSIQTTHSKSKMKSLNNKVNLIGHLGFTPEIKTLNGGRKLAKVTIATNDTYKSDKGERVTETQWHQLVAWGKTAELMERYTRVGSKIALEGKLLNRSYVDKTGQKRTVTEVQVNELMILNNWAGGEPEVEN